MKHTKNMIVKETAESRELVLYITNDSELYHQQITYIINNLAKKYKKGQYDKEKAIDAWYYAAEAGAKKYTKEFAWMGQERSIFDVTARYTAAAELEEYYKEAIEEA